MAADSLMRSRTARGLAAIAVACLVGVAGCGDDDDDDAAGDSAETTASTAASDGGSGDGAAASVSMKDFAFAPSELTVASGDTVSVKNDDSTTHTFTSDGGGFDVTVEAGKSGEARVASTPGTYDFQCTIHPSMTGKITVQ